MQREKDELTQDLLYATDSLPALELYFAKVTGVAEAEGKVGQ